MFLLTAIAIAGAGAALQTDTFPDRPVAAVFVYPAFDSDPIWWASAPHTVLYADRTIIYRMQNRSQSPTFATAKLSPMEYSSFIDALALSPGFFELSDWYGNLPANYEPWYYEVWAWDGKEGKTVSLEGLLDSTARLFKPNSSDTQPRTPRAFVNAARRLLDFSHPGAVAWYPTRFEIVLSKESPTDSDTPWPADWPPFDSDSTFVDARGDYHVPLSQIQMAEYLTCCVHALFDLGGATWRGIARPVIPGDRYWTR